MYTVHCTVQCTVYIHKKTYWFVDRIFEFFKYQSWTINTGASAITIFNSVYLQNYSVFNYLKMVP